MGTLFSRLAHELSRTRLHLVFDMKGQLRIGIRGLLHRTCDMAVTQTQHCNEADVNAHKKNKECFFEFAKVQF